TGDTGRAVAHRSREELGEGRRGRARGCTFGVHIVGVVRALAVDADAGYVGATGGDLDDVGRRGQRALVGVRARVHVEDEPAGDVGPVRADVRRGVIGRVAGDVGVVGTLVAGEVADGRAGGVAVIDERV